MAGTRRRHIDFSHDSGPPVTTGELARVTGLSVRTIQREIECGELTAGRRRHGTQYRISWDEAKRYIACMCESMNVARGTSDMHDKRDINTQDVALARSSCHNS
jgi:excisionase family DNA binding protein